MLAEIISAIALSCTNVNLSVQKECSRQVIQCVDDQVGSNRDEDGLRQEKDLDDALLKCEERKK